MVHSWPQWLRSGQELRTRSAGRLVSIRSRTRPLRWRHIPPGTAALASFLPASFAIDLDWTDSKCAAIHCSGCLLSRLLVRHCQVRRSDHILVVSLSPSGQIMATRINRRSIPVQSIHHTGLPWTTDHKLYDLLRDAQRQACLSGQDHYHRVRIGHCELHKPTSSSTPPHNRPFVL